MEEEKKSEDERRKSYRLPISIPIRYEKIAEIHKGFLSPDMLTREGMILDIGGGGMKIHTDEDIKEGDCLELKMLLSIIPEHQHFFGQVKWVKKDAMPADKPGHTGGICFVELNKKVQKMLLKKVDKIRKITKDKNFL